MSGASDLDLHTKRLQKDLARKELQLTDAEATSQRLYKEKVVLLTKKYELIAEKGTLSEENQQLQERLTKIHKLCGSVHVYHGVDTLGGALKQMEALSGRQQAPGRLPAAAAGAASAGAAPVPLKQMETLGGRQQAPGRLPAAAAGAASAGAAPVPLKQMQALGGRQQAPGRLPAAAAGAASAGAAPVPLKQMQALGGRQQAPGRLPAAAAGAASAGAAPVQVSPPDWWLDLVKIAAPAATAAEKAGIVPARIAAPAATAADAAHASWLEAYKVSMKKLIKRQTTPGLWTPGYSEPMVWGSALLGSKSDGTPAAASNASLVSAGRKRDRVDAS